MTTSELIERFVGVQFHGHGHYKVTFKMAGKERSTITTNMEAIDRVTSKDLANTQKHGRYTLRQAMQTLWNEVKNSNAEQTKPKKRKKLVVISPDGFTISRDETYPSRFAAIRAFVNWRERFRTQGYYSKSNRSRIPLEELHFHCDIQPA